MIVFRDMTRAIAKAEARAKASGKTMCVIEIDEAEEGRIIRIVDEGYTNSDEFEAFGGDVLYVTGQ